MSSVGRATWLRLRHEWRRRWSLLVLLAAIVALAGGACIAGLAAARRTGSATDRLAQRLHFAEMIVRHPGEDVFTELDAGLVDQVAGLPGVSGVQELTFVAAAPAAYPNFFSISFTAHRGISEGFLVLDGRPLSGLDELGSDEVVLNEAMSRELGAGPGDMVEVVTETLDQWLVTLDGSDAGPPRGPTVEAHVAAIGRVFEDVTDAPDPIMVVGPAFVHRYGSDVGTCRCSLGVTLEPGQFEAVRSAVEADHPELEAGANEDFAARVADTVALQRGAWLAIALAAAVAGVLAVAQAAARAGRQFADDDPAHRALGATLNACRWCRVLAVMPAVVVGAAGAVALAYGLSGLAPVGVALRAEPDPGRRWDGQAVGLGAAVALAVGLAVSTLSVVLVRRGTRPVSHIPPVGGPVLRLGLQFVAGPGRLAVLGVVFATAGLTGAITLDRSIDHLLATPRLFGAGFDATTFLTDGTPREAVARDLAADPEIEAVAVVWTGLTSAAAIEVQGPAGRAEVSPAAFEGFTGSIGVTVTRGHAPRASDEVAVGREVMRRIGVEIGDRITAYGINGPVELRVVGDNLDPGVDDSGHGFAVTLEGLGRLVAPSPQGVAARFAEGADRAAILRRHRDVHLEPVAAPSEVTHLGQLGGLPGRLAGLLAALGLVALVNAAVLTLRHGRRDVGIHRALGVTGGQVVRAHAWQGLITAGAGLAIGGFAGVVAAAAVHRRLVADVGALPEVVWSPTLWPTAASILAVCVLVAGAAGAVATRRSTAVVLRAE